MAFHRDSSTIHSPLAVPASMSMGTLPLSEILLMKVSSQPTRFFEEEIRNCLTPPSLREVIVILLSG